MSLGISAVAWAVIGAAAAGAGTAVYVQDKNEDAAQEAARLSEINRKKAADQSYANQLAAEARNEAAMLAEEARAKAENQRLADQQSKRNKDAAKKAQEKMDADAARARRASVFSETEGEGQGTVGEITLDVDDEIDEEEEAQRQGLSV